MPKNSAIRFTDVVALHDLSYVDHEGNPQYRRQSSVPFALDENNARMFAERGAVRLVRPEAVLPASPPEMSAQDAESDAAFDAAFDAPPEQKAGKGRK